MRMIMRRRKKWYSGQIADMNEFREFEQINCLRRLGPIDLLYNYNSIK